MTQNLSMAIIVRSLAAILCAFLICPCLALARADADADALVRAAKQWEVNEVKSLVRKGIDVNTMDKHGFIPLIAACSGADPRWAKSEDQIEVVRFLLENSTRVDGRDQIGRTALMSTHIPKVAELLLEKGANLDDVDTKGLTAVMWQAQYRGHAFVGHVNTLQLLLKKGANPNKADKDGKTALMWACQKGNRASVELLLKHGADVNAKDSSGKTALMYLKENKLIDSPTEPHRGEITVEELLVQHGASK